MGRALAKKGIYLTIEQTKALNFFIWGKPSEFPGKNYETHLDKVFDKLKLQLHKSGSYIIATPRKPLTETLARKLRDN